MKAKYSTEAHNRTFNNQTKYKPLFDLKISEKEKYANDKRWFKDYVNYIVPFTTSSIKDYKEMKLSYDIYNDNLDGYKEELDNFCNPLGENFRQEEIKTYPKLHNNINVLKGEYLKRPDNHKVAIFTAKAIKNKDSKLIEALKESIEEQVRLEVEKTQMVLEGKNPEEVQKYIDSLRTQNTPENIAKIKFQSEQEIFYSKALKYCKHTQQTKLKQMESLQDVMTVDRCFIYSGWKNGKPTIDLRNTINSIFHKAPNEVYVHKGDYFAYTQEITIADCYNNYGQVLTEEDMNKLSLHSYHRGVDDRHKLGPHAEQFVYDRSHINQDLFTSYLNTQDKFTGLHQGNQNVHKHSAQNTVTETHIEFKAFRQLIFLTYTDEYNEKITIVVSKDFDIPKDAKEETKLNRYGDYNKIYTWYDEIMGTQYEAEILWIPRKYEVVRLNSDVFPVIREVPYQSVSLDNPYSNFNLSTFGAVFTSRNSKSISLLQRAIPSYFQYLYVKHIQNRELSKYQGYIQNIDVDQIPQQLGEDVDGNIIKDPVAVHALYMKKTGRNYYSGSQTTASGQLPSTRSPGSTGFILGTAQDIFNLQQLSELIDREISMSMGISPERMSQFSRDSNVTDNQQSITQSHHITEPYFYYLDQLWTQVFEDYLKNFRTYCINNPDHSIFHYILPDGSEELLEVTPQMLEPTDIGIYVTNSSQSEHYNNMMLQLSHSIGQNGGEGVETISTLIKAITSGTSPEETHKLIQIESSKQTKRSQEQEKIKLQVQEEYVQRQREIIEDNQAHEIEKEHIKGEYMLKGKEIDSFKFQQDQDLNNNNVPDQLEIAKFEHQKEQDKIQNKQKEEELKIKKKQANKPATKS